MDNEQLYLKPNVQIEPLVDSWYAWSHLIPPATAARNLTERHLKIMDSYIAAPHIHADAVRNPKMLGGPFIDYQGERVDDIRALRDRITSDASNLISLSKAIAQLDDLLRHSSKALGFDRLYPLVPEELKGYVELVYDLNHNPSFRLIEPLLYRSKYYRRQAQSLVLSMISGDDRPFVLSTPRLDTPQSVRLDIPFDDERVDWLFCTKHTPTTWLQIRDRLDIPDHAESLVLSMFSNAAPPRYQSYGGSGVRWRYFGHACILVETQNVTLLFDPVLSYTYETDITRYTYQDLPDTIDFVVITHNHQDHILFETLLQLRHKVKTFVVPRSSVGSLQDPSVKTILKQIGCQNVIELEELESLHLDGGSITGLPFMGEHADLNIPSKMTYLLRLGKRSLLFLADSCNLEPRIYEYVHQAVGNVDVIFLGMECDGAPLSWLYGPLLTRPIDRSIDHSRRLAGSDYSQAIGFVHQFQSQQAYVYAMGQEPWLNYVMSIKYTDQSRPIVESNKFIAECSRQGICAERLFGEKEIFLTD